MQNVIFTTVVLVFLGAEACAQSPQKSLANIEPPGPLPTLAVQRVLDQATELKSAGDAIAAAEDALKLAEQESDHEGLGLAHRLKARELKELNRSDEALREWHQSALEFEQAGDSAGQIESLGKEGALRFKTEPEIAKGLFSRALALGKAEQARPIAVARAMTTAGYATYDFNDKEPAKNFLLAALQIEQRLEPDSADVAHAYIGYSHVDPEGHNIQKARAILEKVAPDSVDMAWVLVLLVNGAGNPDGYADGKAALRHALEIAEKHRPESDDVLASILNTFGISAASDGDFAEAREYWEHVRAIDAIHPEDADHAQTVLNIGIVSMSQGDLTAARDYCEKALDMMERLAPNHGFQFEPMLCLGQIALDEADYKAARNWLQRAQSVADHASPPSELFETLADVAFREGDLSMASDYARQALQANHQGGDHTRGWLRLGQIEAKRGQLSEALKYVERAIAVSRTRAPHSQTAAEILIELGTLHLQRGEPTLARRSFQDALSFWEEAAPQSWTTAKIYEGLGDVAKAEGHTELAANLYGKSIRILEGYFGPENPNVASGLIKLAEAEARQGNLERAFDSALHAERIGTTHLRTTIQGLSERQALLYASVRPVALDLLTTLLESRLRRDAESRRLAWDAIIQSRAAVLDEMATRNKAIGPEPQVAELTRKLVTARERLANVSVRGVQAYGPEIYRKLLVRTEREEDEIEQLLAEKSAVFRKQRQQRRLGFEQVRSSLDQHSVVVAYIRYSHSNLSLPSSESVSCYAAFILRFGNDTPDFVPLGSARQIEHLWSAWHREISSQAHSMLQSKLAELRYRQSAAALRRAIWDPIITKIGDASQILVVPDGVLHLVNFDALPFGNSRYFAESGRTFHYLTAERDLVASSTFHGQGLLAMGNPNFDRAASETVASRDQFPSAGGNASATALPIFRGSRSACGSFRTLQFASLPGSGQEAEEVGSAWQRSAGKAGDSDHNTALILTGADAGPLQFRELAPGKRILHLATHGFFLEGRCDSIIDKQEAESPDRLVGITAGENPLLLSGLAFAGANRRSNQASDGIITAEEIAAMNLLGVDLAVLSACDTGLGAVKSGEGVFGLRRAFQLAGVNTVVMSLWAVDDLASKKWMRSMYREHLLNGKSVAESVRAANLDAIHERRAAHLSTHPFYWAAFIAAGNRE
jgi:CHAT domain-containing protein/Tfp pilus assembly protein PilF